MKIKNATITIETKTREDSKHLLSQVHESLKGNKDYIDSNIVLTDIEDFERINKISPTGTTGLMITVLDDAELELDIKAL